MIFFFFAGLYFYLRHHGLFCKLILKCKKGTSTSFRFVTTAGLSVVTVLCSVCVCRHPSSLNCPGCCIVKRLAEVLCRAAVAVNISLNPELPAWPDQSGNKAGLA